MTYALMPDVNDAVAVVIIRDLAQSDISLKKQRTD